MTSPRQFAGTGKRNLPGSAIDIGEIIDYNDCPLSALHSSPFDACLFPPARSSLSSQPVILLLRQYLPSTLRDGKQLN